MKVFQFDESKLCKPKQNYYPSEMEKYTFKSVHTKTRNELEPPGTKRKNKKFIGRNCACNTIVQ